MKEFVEEILKGVEKHVSKYLDYKEYYDDIREEFETKIRKIGIYKLSIQVYTGKNMFRSSEPNECNFIPQVGWSLKIPKTWKDDKDSKMATKDEDGNIIDVELVKVKNITYHAIRDFFQVDCCTWDSEEQYDETFGKDVE